MSTDPARESSRHKPDEPEKSAVGHAAGAPGTAPPAVTAEPLLPHERDESLVGTDAQPRPVIEQARQDLDAGMVDTDMRATPGLDAQRRDRLVPPTKPR